jgi:small subunit ribosomal protein S17
MTDENVNEETQDEIAAEAEPETTDAPEGVADVENLPEEAPQGDSAERDSAEPETPETPEAVAEEPGLDEPPGGEPATAQPDEAPEAVGEGPAAEVEPEPVSSEEPVEGPAEDAPAEEPVAEEPAAEAEPTEEPAEGTPPEPAAEAAAPAPAAAPKKKRKRLPRSQRRQRPRTVRERPAERRPVIRLPKPEHERGRRQERQGTVVSAAADKTIVVRVDVVKVHPMYKKVIKRSTRLHAHDEENQAKVGDIVRLVEMRPLSKLKRWRLQEIVEAAK